MSDIPEVLYHYTSTRTFHAIIKNQSVRLSLLNLSNDTMEGKWATRRLLDACEVVGVDMKYWQRIREHLDWIPNSYGALGLCLSTEEDMLSQWRGYADDGFGFCIGFNTEKLV